MCRGPPDGGGDAQWRDAVSPRPGIQVKWQGHIYPSFTLLSLIPPTSVTEPNQKQRARERVHHVHADLAPETQKKGWRNLES